MRCVDNGTVVLLLSLNAFLYAHSASVRSIKDLSETNRILSLWGGEEKCTAEDGCKNSVTCVFFRSGFEKLCISPCDSDGDCENHMKCQKMFNRKICMWKTCTKDDDCEYSSVCAYETSDKKEGACVRPCDCGNKGTCRIEKGQKVCDCDPGFLENDGKCTECDCGPQGTCRFENGMKRCDCGRDLQEYNGKCADCVCRGGECVMDKETKVCKCPPGFGNFTSISCKACDCGPDTDCIWEKRFGGNKICLCKPGYSTKKGKCEVCECGPDYICEWISDGWLKPERKVCRCKPGYQEENGKCVDEPDKKLP